jgi:hypothetical protein
MKFSQADQPHKDVKENRDILMQLYAALNSVAVKASRFISTRMKSPIAAKHQISVTYRENESMLFWMLYSPSKICQ